MLVNVHQIRRDSGFDWRQRGLSSVGSMDVIKSEHRKQTKYHASGKLVCGFSCCLSPAETNGLGHPGRRASGLAISWLALVGLGRVKKSVDIQDRGGEPL